MLGAYDLDPFEHQAGSVCLRCDVYRRQVAGGPPVILIHEAPGLSESTLALADRIAARGFTVALPSLLEAPDAGAGPARMVRGMARMCIAGEFGALARGRTAPIADWLRGLARRESDRAGGAKVGVIGMCFSGGFALATALEPVVGAAVMSQPSLPFISVTDVGVSSEDIDRLKDRVGAGGCLRVLRYQADVKSPRARYERLICEFPSIERVEIATSDRSRHSVLRDGMSAPRGSDLAVALDGTLDFLDRHLREGAQEEPMDRRAMS